MNLKELIGRCAGHAAADASCALARALHGHSNRAESAARDLAVAQLERLLNLHSRARAAGLSLEQFGEAAQHHSTIILRERFGSKITDGAISEMISWPLKLLKRALGENKPKLSAPLH